MRGLKYKCVNIWTGLIKSKVIMRMCVTTAVSMHQSQISNLLPTSDQPFVIYDYSFLYQIYCISNIYALLRITQHKLFSAKMFSFIFGVLAPILNRNLALIRSVFEPIAYSLYAEGVYFYTFCAFLKFFAYFIFKFIYNLKYFFFD